MRVLIDECLPKRLAREFVGHHVSTVFEMGWSGKKNGDLLHLMAAERFDIFITIDQNLQYQQNLSDTTIAVVVFSSVSNRPADILRLVPSANKRLASLKPGEICIIKE